MKHKKKKRKQNYRKIISLLLTVCMIATMSLPVWAAEGGEAAVGDTITTIAQPGEDPAADPQDGGAPSDSDLSAGDGSDSHIDQNAGDDSGSGGEGFEPEEENPAGPGKQPAPDLSGAGQEEDILNNAIPAANELGDTQANALTGVRISGTPKVDETLTAVIEPAEATATYQWFRGDEAISGATAADYKLTIADLGQKIKVTATGSGNFQGSVTSAETEIITKNSQNAPAPAAIKMKTTTSIEVAATAGVEYAVSTDKETAPADGYNTAGRFAELTPDTTYYVWARTAAAEDLEVSEAVVTYPITTRVFGNGSGTKQSPYLIEAVDDFMLFVYRIKTGEGYTGKYFRQTANLDFTGIEYSGLIKNQWFRGVYDGAGHAIQNVTIETTSEVGIFGALSGVIMNLGFEGGNLKSGVIAPIRCMQDGKLINCWSTVTASGGNRVAGLVDQVNSGSTNIVANCWFAGSARYLLSTWGIAVQSGGIYYLEGSLSGGVAPSTVMPIGPVSAKTEAEMKSAAFADELNENRAAAAELTGVAEEELCSWTSDGSGYPVPKEMLYVTQVTVSGTAKVGETLTSTVEPAEATVSYQWQRSEDNSNWADIEGAQSDSYTITRQEAGKYVRLQIRGTDSFTGTLESAGSQVANYMELAVPTKQVYMDGEALDLNEFSIVFNEVDHVTVGALAANGLTLTLKEGDGEAVPVTPGSMLRLRRSSSSGSSESRKLVFSLSDGSSTVTQEVTVEICRVVSVSIGTYVMKTSYVQDERLAFTEDETFRVNLAYLNSSGSATMDLSFAQLNLYGITITLGGHPVDPADPSTWTVDQAKHNGKNLVLSALAGVSYTLPTAFTVTGVTLGEIQYGRVTSEGGFTADESLTPTMTYYTDQKLHINEIAARTNFNNSDKNAVYTYADMMAEGSGFAWLIRDEAGTETPVAEGDAVLGAWDGQHLILRYTFNNGDEGSEDQIVEKDFGTLKITTAGILLLYMVTDPKLSYVDGQTLDLSGAEVTLQLQGDTTTTLPYSRLAEYGVELYLRDKTTFQKTKVHGDVLDWTDLDDELVLAYTDSNGQAAVQGVGSRISISINAVNSIRLYQVKNGVESEVTADAAIDYIQGSAFDDRTYRVKLTFLNAPSRVITVDYTSGSGSYEAYKDRITFAPANGETVTAASHDQPVSVNYRYTNPAIPAGTANTDTKSANFGKLNVIGPAGKVQKLTAQAGYDDGHRITLTWEAPGPDRSAAAGNGSISAYEIYVPSRAGNVCVGTVPVRPGTTQYSFELNSANPVLPLQTDGSEYTFYVMPINEYQQVSANHAAYLLANVVDGSGQAVDPGTTALQTVTEKTWVRSTAVVVGLTAAANSERGITASWDRLDDSEIDGGVLGYYVYLTTQANNHEGVTPLFVEQPAAGSSPQIVLSKEATGSEIQYGTTYYIHITVVNPVGESTRFARSSSVVPYGQPSAVRNIQVGTASNNSIPLTWGEPLETGSTYIDYYTVTWYRFDSGSGAFVKVDSDSNVYSASYSIANLTANTIYRVEITATNPEGVTSEVAYIEAATRSIPLAPGNLSLTPGYSEAEGYYLDFAWKAAEANGAVINGYALYAYEVMEDGNLGDTPAVKTIESTATTYRYLLSDASWLAGGKTYSFQAAATYVTADSATAYGAKGLAVEGEAKVVTGITIGTEPKMSYVDGQRLDLSGLTLRLQYNAGAASDTVSFAELESSPYLRAYVALPNGTEIENGATLNKLTSQNGVLHVVYERAAIRYEVTGAKPLSIEDRIVQSIEIVRQPAAENLSYIEGQALNLDGLAVKLYYNDDSASGTINYSALYGNGVQVEYNGAVINSTASAVTEAVYGQNSVVLRVGSASTEADPLLLTVSARALSGVEIVTQPRLQYMTGATFNPAALVLRLTYSNGKSEEAAYSQLPQGLSVAFDKDKIAAEDDGTPVTVTVTYRNAAGETSSRTVQTGVILVTEGEITQILDVVMDDVKLIYVEGQRLNLTGMEVNTLYEDNVTQKRFTLEEMIRMGFEVQIGAERVSLEQAGSVLMTNAMNGQPLQVIYLNGQGAEVTTDSGIDRFSVSAINTLAVNTGLADNNFNFVEGQTIDLSNIIMNFNYAGMSTPQTLNLSQLADYSVYAWLVKEGQEDVKLIPEEHMSPEGRMALTAKAAEHNQWKLIVRSVTNGDFSRELGVLNVVPKRIDTIRVNSGSVLKDTYNENQAMNYDGTAFDLAFNDGSALTAQPYEQAMAAGASSGLVITPAQGGTLKNQNGAAIGAVFEKWDVGAGGQETAAAGTASFGTLKVTEMALTSLEAKRGITNVAAYADSQVDLMGARVTAGYNFIMEGQNPDEVGGTAFTVDHSWLLAVLSGTRDAYAQEAYQLVIRRTDGTDVPLTVTARNGAEGGYDILPVLTDADNKAALVLRNTYRDNAGHGAEGADYGTPGDKEVVLGTLSIMKNEITKLEIVTAPKLTYVLDGANGSGIFDLSGMEVRYTRLNGVKGTVSFGDAEFADIIDNVKVLNPETGDVYVTSGATAVSLAMNGKTLQLTAKKQDPSYLTTVTVPAGSLVIIHQADAPEITETVVGADPERPEGTRSSVTLTWTADNGSGTIGTFHLYVDGSQTPLDVSAETAVTETEGTYRYTARGLTDNADHSFTISTVNEWGVSSQSGAAKAKTWNAPTDAYADVSLDSAANAFIWSKPTLKEGNVTGFHVIVTDSAGQEVLNQYFGPEVTGLPVNSNYFTEGGRYTVKAAVCNEIGEGPFSDITRNVTNVTAAAPMRPTLLKAAATDGQLSVSWVGSAGATGYTVTATDGTSDVASEHIAVSGTTAVLTGLTNGTPYTVSVAAYNETGSSETAAITGTPKAAALTGIEITVMPRTAYTVGETLDLSAMVITATFDDGSSAAVTGYTLSDNAPEGALSLADNGTVITVSYTAGGVTKTAEFAITVSEAATGVTVSGYVGWIGATDLAVDAVRGITVKLISGESEMASVTTSDLGLFSFENVTAGAYTLSIEHENCLTRNIDIVVAGENLVLSTAENMIGIYGGIFVEGKTVIDMQSFAQFMKYVGTENGDSGYTRMADFDNSDNVDMKDFAIFMKWLGKDLTSYEEWQPL